MLFLCKMKIKDQNCFLYDQKKNCLILGGLKDFKCYGELKDSLKFVYW